MPTIIWYFSGTGNSLSVAQKLAQEIPDSKLLPIASYFARSTIPLDSADRVGFVFPVYAFGLPALMYEFIDKVQITGDPYIFAVATCGGMPGRPLSAIDELLRKHGKKLHSGFILIYPGNYTPLYGAHSEQFNKSIIERASKRIPKIAKKISKKCVGFVDMEFFPFSFISRFISWGFRKFVNQSDQKFYAAANCTHCEICAKVCPVGNITLNSDKMPQWLGKCQQCMACLQFCPVEAIQFGKVTIGRRRYRHPEISWQDIAKQKCQNCP